MKELGVTAPEVTDKIFIARSAIYYGPYDIVIAKSKHHHKETFTGDAPETCTRIIGNEPDPKLSQSSQTSRSMLLDLMELRLPSLQGKVIKTNLIGATGRRNS
jgi:hypothetical protein